MKITNPSSSTYSDVELKKAINIYLKKICDLIDKTINKDINLEDNQSRIFFRHRNTLGTNLANENIEEGYRLVFYFLFKAVLPKVTRKFMICTSFMIFTDPDITDPSDLITFLDRRDTYNDCRDIIEKASSLCIYSYPNERWVFPSMSRVNTANDLLEELNNEE